MPESKLSLKSVKSTIKAEVLLSKPRVNVHSVAQVAQITREKQWFGETEALPPQENA